MHAEQVRIFQSMTPGRKLRLAVQLHESARRLKISALRRQHPDWADDRIAKKAREVFLYAGT